MGAGYIAPSALAPVIFEPEERPEVLQAMPDFRSRLHTGSDVPVAG
ncbi:hypothetical protein [Mycobacterium sp.]|nr:hypothetical protein [Mycobacterium sp.]